MKKLHFGTASPFAQLRKQQQNTVEKKILEQGLSGMRMPQLFAWVREKEREDRGRGPSSLAHFTVVV